LSALPFAHEVKVVHNIEQDFVLWIHSSYVMTHRTVHYSSCNITFGFPLGVVFNAVLARTLLALLAFQKVIFKGKAKLAFIISWKRV